MSKYNGMMVVHTWSKPISGDDLENAVPSECCPFCRSWAVYTLPHTNVDWCGGCGTAWLYTAESDRYVYRPSVARISTLARARNFVVSWFWR